MDGNFPMKTSTYESKGEILMDCNHMNQTTTIGKKHLCTEILQNSFRNHSTFIIVLGNRTPLWLKFNRKEASPRYIASPGTESILGN